MADKSRKATLKELLQDLELIQDHIDIVQKKIKLLLSKENTKDGKAKKGL